MEIPGPHGQPAQVSAVGLGHKGNSIGVVWVIELREHQILFVGCPLRGEARIRLSFYQLPDSKVWEIGRLPFGLISQHVSQVSGPYQYEK